MKRSFGAFELDTDRRVLLLDGQEVALQRRAFDLLVCLVEADGRVVSKEELLDRLWPDVVVTEASIQRAVSLVRAALRRGGFARAVRNVPRVGYRFCIDTADTNAFSPEAGEVTAAEDAYRAGEWSGAVVEFERVGTARSLPPASLWHWANALERLGRPADAIPVLTRAVAASSSTADSLMAARAAIDLARIHFERGEEALVSGWLSRAERLIGEDRRNTAFVWLLWMRSRLASVQGHPQLALDLVSQAHDTSRQLADAEIEALTLVYRGFFRLSLGDTRKGIDDQDHAAAIALSADADPLTVNLIYCNILWSCRTHGDWTRANQWFARYLEFCQEQLGRYTGTCQLHHAELLGVQGSLADARAYVTDALGRLESDAPWSLGDAHRVLGDIHAELGDAEAAMGCYERALALGWDANPGLAMLLLDRGEAEAACESLERSLIGQDWWTLQRRVMLQAHLAVASATAGRRARAQELIGRLAKLPDKDSASAARALVSEATAILVGSEGHRDEAVRHLHLARQLWTSVAARQHETRLRIRIAESLLERGDARGANAEFRAACIAIDALGTSRYKNACERIRSRLESGAAA